MASIKALLHEREGYVAHGRLDRVAQVDAELAKLGVNTTVDELPVEAAVPDHARVERAVRGRARPR